MLEVLLQGSDAQGFRLEPTTSADALLIDYDAISSNVHQLQRWTEKIAKTPSIVVTSNVAATSLPALLIERPLSFSALKDALRKLRDQVKDAQSARNQLAKQIAEVTQQNEKPQPVKLDKATLSALVAEAQQEVKNTGAAVADKAVDSVKESKSLKTEAVSLLNWTEAQKQELEMNCCGQMADLDLHYEAEKRRVLVNMAGTFLAILKDAVTKGRVARQPIQIRGIPGSFVFLPASEEFAYDQDLDFLLQIARSKFKMGELQLLERPDLSDCEYPRAKADELLWLLSLSTLRGRVPDDLGLENELKLRKSPDFDRLLSIPYSRSIARLWGSRFYNAIDVAKILAIPQRFVFSFMVAADAVELFERK